MQIVHLKDRLFYIFDLKALMQVNEMGMLDLKEKNRVEAWDWLIPITARMPQKNPPKPSRVVKNPKICRKAELLITQECNLACAYCYSSPVRSEAMMSLDVAKTVVRSIIQAAYIKKRKRGKEKKAEIHFHGGGEPTCAFSLLKEIMGYAYDLGQSMGIEIEASISTNACMAPSQLQWLLDHQFSFYVSLDGLASVQNLQRPSMGGQPTFEMVAATLDVLEREKCRYSLRATVTAHNVKELSEFIRYVAHRWPSVVFIKLSPLMMTERSNQMQILPPQEADFLEEMEKAHETARREGIVLADVVEDITHAKPICAGVRMEQLIVDTTGKLILCHERVHEDWMQYGEVRQNAIHYDVEKIEQIKKRLDAFLDSSACGHCFAKAYCLGGCISRRMTASEDFFCMWRKERYKKHLVDLFYTAKTSNSGFKVFDFKETQDQSAIQKLVWLEGG